MRLAAIMIDRVTIWAAWLGVRIASSPRALLLSVGAYAVSSPSTPPPPPPPVLVGVCSW